MAAAGTMLLAGCGGGDGGNSAGAATASGGAAAEMTNEQLQWALDVTKGQDGAADPSKDPVVLGFVNQQGGTLSFPEAEASADATVRFVNERLGGIQGHPLELHKCLAAAPTDAQRCGQEMANDSAVQAIVVPLLLQNNEAFYQPIGGKKPVLSGGLYFPIDLTTPNVYSYESGTFQGAVSSAVFAKHLGAKRVILVRTDNPAGLSSTTPVSVELKKAGIEAVDVPVAEPGTAPAYAAALRAANIRKGDVIELHITSIGAVSVYDALKTLNIPDIPVIGSELHALEPVPGHLKDLGAKDTVYPDGWYTSNAGYMALYPQPNTNGTDVYTAMMAKYAPVGASNFGYAPPAFQMIMSMARFYNEDGPEATADQVATSVRTWQGPAPLTAGPLRCGALQQAPNLCMFTIGHSQRKDGKWVSALDGLDGQVIDTLTGEIVKPTG
jgi:branched-chain amino acid transport system substrate-binding protein